MPAKKATEQMATRAAGRSKGCIVVLAGGISLFQWTAVDMCERAKGKAEIDFQGLVGLSRGCEPWKG
jgi:hypothetical protein